MSTNFASDETIIHKKYMTWVIEQERLDSRYSYIVHVPNQGKRSFYYGKLLKDMGMRKGFPDIICHYPVAPFNGFAIEFKSDKGKVRPEQANWLSKLTVVGYACIVLRDHREAERFTDLYMTGALKSLEVGQS